MPYNTLRTIKVSREIAETFDLAIKAKNSFNLA